MTWGLPHSVCDGSIVLVKECGDVCSHNAFSLDNNFDRPTKTVRAIIVTQRRSKKEANTLY